MSQTVTCTLSQEVQFFGKEIQENIYSHIKSSSKLIEVMEGKMKNKSRREGENRNGKPYVILSSSRQTSLLYQFPVSEVSSFLIKAYHLPLMDIARHYISVQKFKDQMSNIHFSFEEKLVTITVADVFGVGCFQLDNQCVPFLIQRFSKGLNLSEYGKMEYKITHSLLPTVFRKITKTGFIIDPYPHNWFIHGYSPENTMSDYFIFEYIDLVYENSLSTIKEAKQVINSFEPIFF